MFKVKTAVITFFSVYPINYGSSVVCSSFFKNWHGKKKLFQISNKNFKSNKIISTPILFNNNILKILSVIYQILKAYNYLKSGNEKKILILEGASWIGYSFLTFYVLKFFLKNVFIIYKGHSIEYEIRKKNNSLLIANISNFFERYIYKYVDLSTSVSKIEQKKIKLLYKVNSIIFPNIIEIFKSEKKKNKLKNYIFYCGSYLYKPNKIVIDYLIKKIMPEVRKKDNKIKLVLTGTETKKFNQDWVRNIGLVSKKKFISILKSSICMAIPSKEGYGTRVKIIESLCYGAITLTTPIGIEGIEYNKKSSSPVICKSINDFPNQILNLKKEHKQIKNKIKKDIKYYSEYYSAKTATQKFYKLLIKNFL